MSAPSGFHYVRGRRPFDPRWRFVTGFHLPHRLLDIGCGWGESGRHFREQYPDAEIHGVDLSETGPDWLIYARCDLDRDDLPYSNGYFDGVYISQVLEHLRTPVRVAREIGRVLAPGGVVYVETPNWVSTVMPSRGFLWGRKTTALNFWDDPTHIRPWTKHGLYSWLSDYAGLEVVAHGARRNLPRLPLDLVAVPVLLAVGRVEQSLGSWKNLVGWSVFGIGRKPGASGQT